MDLNSRECINFHDTFHAPVFALDVVCHAHFRDGVFGAQHVRDVAKGGRKQGDLAWPLLATPQCLGNIA